MKIKPLGSRVLVKVIKSDELKSTGKVIEMGCGAMEELKVGDTVLFTNYAGINLGLSVVLPEEDVFAVLESK